MRRFSLAFSAALLLVVFSFGAASAQTSLPSSGVVSVYGVDSPTDREIDQTFFVQLYTDKKLPPNSYVTFQFRDERGGWRTITSNFASKFEARYGKTNIIAARFVPVRVAGMTTADYSYNFSATVTGAGTKTYSGSLFAFKPSTTTIVSSTQNKPPSVTVTYAPQSPNANQLVTLTASATDDNGLYFDPAPKTDTITYPAGTSIQIYLDNILYVGCTPKTLVKSYSCSATGLYGGQPLPAGTHTYYATANDNAGRASSTPVASFVVTGAQSAATAPATSQTSGLSDGVVSVFGASNPSETRIDQKYFIQLYTTTPLNPADFDIANGYHLQFQFLDTDGWHGFKSATSAAVKIISQLETRYGKDNIRVLDFTPAEIGMTKTGFAYDFRAVIYDQKSKIVKNYIGGRMTFTPASASKQNTISKYPSYLYKNDVPNFFIVAGSDAATTTLSVANKIADSLHVQTRSGVQTGSSDGIVRLDTEIGSAEKTKNLIIVGGSCANRLTAQLAEGSGGFPYKCDNLPSESFGMIYIIDDAYSKDNLALVVAGTSDDYLRLAADVLVNPKYTKGWDTSRVKITGNLQSVLISPELPSPSSTSSATVGVDVKAVLETEKESYNFKDLLKATGQVISGSNPLKGAKVELDFVLPGGTSLGKVSVTTDSLGKFVYGGYVPGYLARTTADGIWNIVARYQDKVIGTKTFAVGVPTTSTTTSTAAAPTVATSEVPSTTSYGVGSGKQLKVTANKDSFLTRDLLSLTVELTSGSAPLKGETLSIDIILPSGSTLSSSSYVTDSSGKYVLIGNIPRFAGGGSAGDWKFVVRSGGVSAEKTISVTDLPTATGVTGITVGTDKSAYSVGSLMVVTGSVKSNPPYGAPNIEVLLEFVLPSGTVFGKVTQITDSLGSFSYKANVPLLINDASIGTWKVLAKYGTLSAEKTFTVSSI